MLFNKIVHSWTIFFKVIETNQYFFEK